MSAFLDIILNIQKIPDTIINSGYKRKIFEFHKNNNGFVAINSSRNTLWNLLFFGIMSITIFSGIISLIQGEKFDLESFIVGFIVLPIFGIIGLRKFLWLARGKEILTVKNNEIIIEKVGSFLLRPKVYKLSLIKNIKSKYEAKRYSNIPVKIAKRVIEIKETNRVFTSFTIGEIEFEYENKIVKVFNDLNDEERDLIISELKKLPTTTV